MDARVPREDRDRWPLVFAGDRLAWVPGVAIDADGLEGDALAESLAELGELAKTAQAA